MTVIFKQFHESGLTVSQALSFIANEVGTNGTKPSVLIKKWNAKIADELAIFDTYGGTLQNREITNTIIKPYQEKIAELEDVLLNRLYEYLKHGVFVAFGYNDIANPYPTGVPVHEWNSLEIDKNKNVAYCEDRKYTSIKLVHRDSLKKQLDELTQLNGNNAEIAPNTLAETEQVEESIIDLENVSEQASIKPRKKLKRTPSRYRDNGLSLVREVITRYNVEYEDQLPANKAWAKVVSGEFTSKLIVNISDTKRIIKLIEDDELTKEDFSEKYRKRFSSK